METLRKFILVSILGFSTGNLFCQNLNIIQNFYPLNFYYEEYLDYDKNNWDEPKNWILTYTEKLLSGQNLTKIELRRLKSSIARLKDIKWTGEEKGKIKKFTSFLNESFFSDKKLGLFLNINPNEKDNPENTVHLWLIDLCLAMAPDEECIFLNSFWYETLSNSNAPYSNYIKREIALLISRKVRTTGCSNLAEKIILSNYNGPGIIYLKRALFSKALYKIESPSLESIFSTAEKQGLDYEQIFKNNFTDYWYIVIKYLSFSEFTLDINYCLDQLSESNNSIFKKYLLLQTTCYLLQNKTGVNQNLKEEISKNLIEYKKDRLRLNISENHSGDDWLIKNCECVINK